MSIRFIGPVAAVSAALACVAGPASAAYLLNPDFEGATGVTVTTVGPGGASTKSAGWAQFTVVPGGTLSTTLQTSTAPVGGGNEIHVFTDSGVFTPAQQGNGFGQVFIGATPLGNAKLTYELDVVSGSVTGGLTKDAGSIGVFTAATPTHGPTGGWITVTDQLAPGDLALGVFFETLTQGQGADYYVADVSVIAIPEPSAWALMTIGLAGLGLALRGSGRRRVGAAV